MLFSVEQAFVGRDEKRSPLKRLRGRLQNTWPEHNKGVAPIPYPREIGPLGVGTTIVFVVSDIVSFSQGVQAIQLGTSETG